MRCDKCENEAMLHYTAEINGEKSEYHLCADCAKAEGFGELLSFNSAPMFESLFSRPMGRMDSFFASPFSMLSDGFFGSRMLSPTLLMPRVMIQIGGETGEKAQRQAAPQPVLENTENIPEDAGEEIRAKRELSMLRQELKNVIKAEEFEKAAELRDKIRKLEK